MVKKSALTLWFTGEELLTGKIETSFRQITTTPKEFRPVQIAAGNKHLLVLEENGRLWSYGTGKEGQLGLGPDTLQTTKFERVRFTFSKSPRVKNSIKDSKKKSRPSKNRPTKKSSAITFSENSKSSIDKNEMDFKGDLAEEYGTIRRRVDKLQQYNEKKRKKDVIVSIESGPIISIAITSSGKIFVWGGTFQETLYHPTPLALWHSWQVVQASVGNQHGIILCKNPSLSSCTIFAWGRSSAGALGLGEKEIYSQQPRQLKFFDNKKPIYVSAGANSSAAITEEGILYIWGNSGLKCDTTPQQVNLHPVSRVLLGDRFNFAVLQKKHLYSWGFGALGVLGHGDNEDRKDPTLVQFFDPSVHGRLTRIACAHSHAAFCTDRGYLFTVGNGDNGALGNQMELSSLIPFFVYNTGFVRNVSCASRSTFILSDRESVQISWEALMEKENHEIPVLLHHLFSALLANDKIKAPKLFSGKGDFQRVQEILYYYSNAYPKINQKYKFDSIDPQDLSLILHSFLSSMPDPLFPSSPPCKVDVPLRCKQPRKTPDDNNNILLSNTPPSHSLLSDVITSSISLSSSSSSSSHPSPPHSPPPTPPEGVNHYYSDIRNLGMICHPHNTSPEEEAWIEIDPLFPSFPIYKKILYLRLFLSNFPEINFNISRHLLQFLHLVLDNEEHNGVNMEKLTQLFTNIFFSYSDNVTMSMLSTLIEFSHIIFSNNKKKIVCVQFEEICKTNDFFPDFYDFVKNYISKDDLTLVQPFIIQNLLDKIIKEYLKSTYEMHNELLKIIFSSILPNDKLNFLLTSLPNFRNMEIDPNSENGIIATVTLLCSLYGSNCSNNEDQCQLESISISHSESNVHLNNKRGSNNSNSNNECGTDSASEGSKKTSENEDFDDDDKLADLLILDLNNENDDKLEKKENNSNSNRDKELFCSELSSLLSLFSV